MIRRRVPILPGGAIQIEDSRLPWRGEAEVVITVLEPEEGVLQKQPQYDSSARPFWAEVIEIGASIPMDEWDKVPTDLSKNIDHYLYGSPKRET